MAPRWYVTDHRAPRWAPRGEDPLFFVACVEAILAVPLIVVGIVALIWPNPQTIVPAAVLFLALMIWSVTTRRRLVPIPGDEDGSCARISRDVRAIQDTRRAYPGLAGVIDPVLLVAYRHARVGAWEPVAKRRTVVDQLVADLQASSNTEDDLTELRNLIAIRRDMRKDGLL